MTEAGEQTLLQIQRLPDAREVRVGTTDAASGMFQVSQPDYDRFRDLTALESMKRNGVHAMCQAPFTTLRIGQRGHINVCNHMGQDAQLGPELSILEYWNGTEVQHLRRQMLDYELRPDACPHCVHQIQSGTISEAFSIAHFDGRVAESPIPEYPKNIIFYLSNTCNLACLMCSASNSSVIETRYEGRPPSRFQYPDSLFDELEVIFPHLEHIELYGGEPFLIEENFRLFEIIERTKSTCTIFVNTNANVLTRRAKHYLNTLNFDCVAISIDAVSATLHGEVRIGIRHERFLKNVDWLLDLRSRRNITVGFNVTEHRRNWFELPQIIRFADECEVAVHINHCIFPSDVTLYTLPTDQLCYVEEFLQRAFDSFKKKAKLSHNVEAFQYLLALIAAELSSRTETWEPEIGILSHACDGRLGVPIPGSAPFDTPEKLLHEFDRMEQLANDTAIDLFERLLERLEKVENLSEWKAVEEELHLRLRKLEPC